MCVTKLYFLYNLNRLVCLKRLNKAVFAAKIFMAKRIGIVRNFTDTDSRSAYRHFCGNPAPIALSRLLGACCHLLTASVPPFVATAPTSCWRTYSTLGAILPQILSVLRSRICIKTSRRPKSKGKVLFGTFFYQLSLSMILDKFSLFCAFNLRLTYR